MLDRSDRTQSFFGALADAISGDWNLRARPDQLAPVGDWWTIWLLLGGRGAGRTRSGAEWVRAQAMAGVSRIALIGPTAGDVRDIMIEGPSGILSISADHDRPVYQPALRKLEWPNGIKALTYSADEPERLRGGNHGAIWADELAAWRLPAAWDMAMLGLRHGSKPRAVVTTTPRPSRLIRALVEREGKDVAITRASTYANAENLAKPFLDQIVSQYAGTRLGRQEIDAELLLDTPGALWTRAMLDGVLIQRAPQLKRVVVAVDPSGTRGASDSGDAIGIVVAGLGVDGLAYVLADRSCKLSPDGWGRRAVDAYHEFKADRIVAERNFGGAMVEHVIRSVDRNISYKEVSASRGKIARAEPCAALYEQGRVKHVGIFTDLEDELCNMTGSGYAGEFA